MKYPLFVLPNQSPNQVVIQGHRKTFEKVFEDFDNNLSNKRILTPVRDQFRQHESEIIRVRLSKQLAADLIQLVGLSY